MSDWERDPTDPKHPGWGDERVRQLLVEQHIERVEMSARHSRDVVKLMATIRMEERKRNE